MKTTTDSPISVAIMAVLDNKPVVPDERNPEELPQRQISEMFYRIKGVIPEEVLNKMSALADVAEKMQWEFGDLTNVIYNHVQASKVKDEKGRLYTFLDVCFFVSIVCIRGQRQMSTVKSWALTARHYSVAVRQTYHADDVPFRHFTFAAQEKFAKIWKNVLKYSYDQSIEKGYPVTERQLREKFDPQEKPVFRKRYEPAKNDFVPADTVASLDMSEIEDEPLVKLDQLISELNGLTSELSVTNPNIGSFISQAILLLRKALNMMAISTTSETLEIQ